MTILLLLEIGTTNPKLKSRIPRRAKPLVLNIMTINLPFGFAAHFVVIIGTRYLHMNQGRENRRLFKRPCRN